MRRLLLLLALVSPLAAFAEPPAAEVDTAQLKGWLLAGKKIVVIDARSDAEYLAGHVPGALGIPSERTGEEGWRLPTDKTVPIIYYCRGPGCGLSREAATVAWQLGHRSVMIYPGGFPDWQAKGNPVVTGQAPGSMKPPPKAK